MRSRRSYSLATWAVLVCVLLAAIVGIPLGALVTPLLWMVVLAVAFAVLLGATAFRDRLIGVGACLVGFLIGWPMLSVVIKGAFTDEMGIKTTLVLGLLVVLTLLAAFLLLVAKIRSFIPIRKLERPAHWDRRPVLEPLDVVDEERGRGPGADPSFPDSNDDLGLYGDSDAR